jgi:putative heme iron utilization protein
MDAAAAADLRALLARQPIAALGTLHAAAQGDEPFVSMVPVAWLAGSAPLPVIHVSGLAPHTRDLQRCPRVSLMLTSPLAADDNPQALARLTIQAEARVLVRGADPEPAARAAYLARFPRAEQTFALGDFRLVLLQPRSARFVAGFGRAHGLTAAGLALALTAA